MKKNIVIWEQFNRDSTKRNTFISFQGNVVNPEDLDELGLENVGFERDTVPEALRMKKDEIKAYKLRMEKLKEQRQQADLLYSVEDLADQEEVSILVEQVGKSCPYKWYQPLIIDH